MASGSGRMSHAKGRSQIGEEQVRGHRKCMVSRQSNTWASTALQYPLLAMGGTGVVVVGIGISDIEEPRPQRT
jgi:hypothetical protein